eukprot:114565-Lingulodinium_polyedra.AAC.1
MGAHDPDLCGAEKREKGGGISPKRPLGYWQALCLLDLSPHIRPGLERGHVQGGTLHWDRKDTNTDRLTIGEVLGKSGGAHKVPTPLKSLAMSIPRL